MSVPATITAGIRSLTGSVLPKPPVVPDPAGANTFRAFRHRNYCLFFSGQLFSLIGTWVQNAAIPWLAFELTETCMWPALVLAAQFGPTLLLSAWGGVLADRYSRQRLLLCTQCALMLLALTLGLLTLLGSITVWHLLVVALLCGVVNAIDLPVRLAFLVEMVGKEDLMNAVALNSLMFNVARVLGPAIGAWLLPFGPAYCFFLNAVSFLAIIINVWRMRGLNPAVPAPDRNVVQQMQAGLRYVTRHPTLSLLLVLVSCLAFFGWPVLSLLPALSAIQMHSGEQGYTWMLSLIGAGALVSAFLVATFGSMQRRRLFIGGGVCIASLGMLGLSFAGSLLCALPCCALIGMGLVMFFSTSQATVQLSASDHNRGRVMGLYSIVLCGATPLGNLLAGPCADTWTVPVVLRLQGIGICMAAAVVVFCLWRRQRSVHSRSR